MTHTKSILVVEDEKPLAHALQLKLEREGFEVTIASNGQECLRLLSTQKFNVVLLDLMMPVVDGFRVLEQLNDNPKEMPTVFVLSNLSQPADEARVQKLGAKKFFVKSETPLADIVDHIKLEAAKH